MIDLLLDSLSRCFGTPTDSNSCAIIPMVARSKRVSRDHSNDNTSPPYTLSMRTRHIYANTAKTRNNDSIKKKLSLELSGVGKDNDIMDSIQNNASPRNKPINRRHSASIQTIPRRSDLDLSMSHRASLIKTRLKTNKRKAEIFRPRDGNTLQHPKNSSASSFATRLLTGKSSLNTSAILCFANPIYDDDDDGQKTKIETNDSMLYNTDLDAETDTDTINSVLYFDAKFEHINESGPLVPLYSEFALPISSNSPGDEIRHILETGSHISRLNITQYDFPPESFGADSGKRNNYNTTCVTSFSHDNSLYDDIKIENDFPIGSNNKVKYMNNINLEGNDGTIHDNSDELIQVRSSVRTSSFTRQPESRLHLDVVSDWVCSPTVTKSTNVAPGLKLLNKSSLSTAALTPIGSSQSSYITTSPILESFHYKNSETLPSLTQSHC